MINQHKTTRHSIQKYNKSAPLVEHLAALVGDRTDVKIADVGSGPFSTIGRTLDGVKVEIYALDNQDFTGFWKKNNVTPLFPIEKQDMEKLTYPDNFFDIVHCENALDHTINALAALKEMIRVCKLGGWVYIDCSLDQLETGHKHYWNVKEDGTVTNNLTIFNLADYGFQIEFIDNGGESRYNRIIATLEKK